MIEMTVPGIYSSILEDSPACLIGLSNLYAGEFFMSICTKLLPIEDSKLIFDFLLLQQNQKMPEKSLLDLLSKMLIHVEPRFLML
jgi:hypothetical protein